MCGSRRGKRSGRGGESGLRGWSWLSRARREGRREGRKEGRKEFEREGKAGATSGLWEKGNMEFDVAELTRARQWRLGGEKMAEQS